VKNIIIPGFSTNAEIFTDFIKLVPDCEILDNSHNSYSETKKQLDETAKSCKINLFGWSLGSMFALKYSIDNPEKINSLFLTGATARFTNKAGYDNCIDKSVVEKMLRLIVRRKDLVTSDFYKTILEYTHDSQKYFDIMMQNTPDEKSLTNGLNELLELDLLDETDKITVPTLISHGKYDKTTPITGAEILKSKIKSSELKIYEGGHCYFLEKPTECAEVWNNFLCSLK